MALATLSPARPGRARPTKTFSILAFGKAIKRRRMAQHITLDELSRRTGFAVSSLSDLENGRKLTFQKAAAICGALGVRLSVMVAASEGIPEPMTTPTKRPG